MNLLPCPIADEFEDPSERVKLSQVARERGLNPCTTYRWHLKGLPLRNGRRQKLEALMIGKTLWTTRSALKRFWGAIASSANPDPSSIQSQIRTPSQRAKSHETAMAELATKGIS